MATTTERGLGGKHQADKKRLKATLRDGEPCWRCGQPMYRWQDLERDHIIDRVHGGADGPAVLAHARCNRSAGATMGNQMRGFAPMVAKAPGATCKTCGQGYHYAARSCEICGAHYHPSHGEQRTCGRACGAELVRRNKRAAGWVPKAERSKPPRKERDRKTWPSSPIHVYTCRYCGKPGVTRATGTRREVCPDRACQLARLAANNLRVRNGLSKEDADAQQAAIVTAGTRSYGRWPSATRW